MRFLIIGGAGLLGSHLAPFLVEQGHEVAIYDNFSGSIQYRVPKGYRTFTSSATDLNLMQHAFASFKPEVLVVAPAYVVPKDSIYTFFEDTKVVLDSANVVAALITPELKHVYFCSSSEVYGGPETKRPLKENRKIKQSATLHGAAKLSSELFLSHRCAETGVPFTALRIFDMYGPRFSFSARTGIISFLIDSFLRDEKIGLRGASRHRDFIHVSDVVSAFGIILDSGYAGVVNVGTGKGVTLKEVAIRLSQLIDISGAPLDLADGKIPTYSSVADTSILGRLSSGGWKPKVDLLEELPELVAFRKSELEFYSRSNPMAILNIMRGL